MAIVNFYNSGNNKCLGGCREIVYCWWRCKIFTHCGKQFGGSLNVEHRITPLLGIYPRKTEIYVHTEIGT